ncbi:bacterio-opsin activator domain-containing protein [Haladaptatus caseinilyticus]|uniref:bacterio-opsin activator domain-containing protein n=1 Tax=Haladaptatus caseinilyticus TaxID=2993314 RepID=UPI00224AF1E8|nr:bacterio-opsin activator domain-containing protein [Haladaptatus caseinilyticus]
MDELTVHSVLDMLPDVFYAYDTSGSLVEWNRRLTELSGYDDDEIEGMHPLDFVPEEDEDMILDAIDSVLTNGHVETRQSALVTRNGEKIPFEFNARQISDANGTVRGFVGVGRNISDRRRRERELRRERDRTRQIFETSPIGIVIFDAEATPIEVNDRASEILGMSKSEIANRSYESWNLLGSDGNPVSDDERPVAAAVRTGKPTYDMTYGIDRPTGDRVWLSVNTAPIFDADGDVVEVITSIADITEQRNRERELRRQRDELGTFNRINEIVREVTHALVSAATREEIEQTVCERLAASELYQFAWVGEYDVVEEGLVSRTSAGDDEGYHEIITRRIGSDQERPAETALRTGDSFVTRDISKEPSLPAELRSEGVNRGIHSGIAVPLSYGQTTYGVLVVYASRTDAFSEREADGFEALGELVGFAINATESKKLLTTGSIVELEFDVADEDALLVPLSRRADCTFVLEGTVPTSDGQLLYYLRTEGSSPERVAEVANTFSKVEDARVISSHDDTGLLVLSISESLVQLFVEIGAKVRTARAQKGEEHLVVEVAQDTDIRTLIDSVQSSHPDVELVAKREVEPTEEGQSAFRESFSADLTSRQRAAFRAAYLAGYYDWPRGSTAEDVADTMEIAPATLHQHLRKAEGKLASAFFGDDRA